MREKIGLWLAYWALRLTGNEKLANVSQVIPLIPKRRLAIGPAPLDEGESVLFSQGKWWLWGK